jgi:FkbM family methyltransferase
MCGLSAVKPPTRLGSNRMSNALTTEIRALAVEDGDLADWGQSSSWQFKISRFWARHMPRGKGWFPRQIGRHFGGTMRDTIRTASGAQLAIEPASLDMYCSIEKSGGLWDPQVLEVCCRFLKPGGVFYDIGANVGLMSVEVARRFSDQVRVFAFEPQPSLARTIAISARLNNYQNLRVFPIMLGKEPGRADLFIASHSIHASAVSREAGAAAIHCPVGTIDQMLGDGLLAPPDVIKIDVEGGEFDVFRGAQKAIAQHRPAITFESDENANRFGYTRKQLCEFLRETAGYRFYAIAGDKLTPAEEAIERNDFSVRDMVALREEMQIPD